jgi:hypothetical protein
MAGVSLVMCLKMSSLVGNNIHKGATIQPTLKGQSQDTRVKQLCMSGSVPPLAVAGSSDLRTQPARTVGLDRTCCT